MGSSLIQTPELSSGRGRQRKRSALKLMTTLSPKPSPFTPNPSRNQAMLNNSKEINTGLQHHIPMSKPTPTLPHCSTDIEPEKGPGDEPSRPIKANTFPHHFFQRVPTIQKNTKRRKRGLTFFMSAISPGVPLKPKKTIHA